MPLYRSDVIVFFEIEDYYIVW